MYVHPSGKCHPEMTGIYTDDLIPDLERLAQAIHDEGGKVVAQINHGGMQCSTETVDETVAPSAINVDFLKQPARELTVDEIEALIDAFAQATRRAKQAGFDGIQLHAAHGYLINQFHSPFVNRRQDEWGGRLENRARFLIRVCRAVREQVPPDVARVRRLAVVRPYGLDAPLEVSELLPPAAEMPELSDEHLGFYESALDAFLSGAWPEALELLHRIPTEDQVKDFLTVYIAQNNRTPPADWDGVIPLESK
jgi:2,4-dienoyl-CoA reductase-like NADH-dependent reductase (Old Yellow Enzyme family)